MRKRGLCLALGVLLAGILGSACAGQIPVSGSGKGSAATQSAQQTWSAASVATQAALEAEVNQLRTQVAQAGPAGESSQAATSTTLPPTPVPTLTSIPPTPTRTPVPPTPTPTAVTLACNLVQFVADVSIPDGSVVQPGASFTKTWRLKNIGSCTWTTDYALVFADGDRLGGPAGLTLPGSVLPGQVIDLSVDLVAPFQAGSYHGNWRLRDAGGVLFGLGRANSPFYVAIEVTGSQSANALDFVATYCQAEWSSGAGQLPCPGESSDSRGSIRRITKPTLENGLISDDPALLTYPQMISDGVIRGKYPSVRVEPGYHFTTIIGCAYNSDACDVNFQLDYQIGSSSIQTLAVWQEVYDGTFHRVDVDLGNLAGSDVNFILTVFANGVPTQDRALWLAPHIATK
jgi:Ig-like domain from next to BRCA1 gene